MASRTLIIINSQYKKSVWLKFLDAIPNFYGSIVGVFDVSQNEVVSAYSTQ